MDNLTQSQRKRMERKSWEFMEEEKKDTWMLNRQLLQSLHAWQ